jgi:RimJ/RimL family protein N-acetyltransferase
VLTPLTAADAPALQRLFERCTEFWELIEGARPAPEKAIEELTSIAPGRTIDDTFTFGVREDGQLIAFVQMARGYPTESAWWIGLLLIDPAHRGRGLGAEIHGEIAAYVEARGGTALGIVVQVQNEAAYGFWRRLGYVETGRQTALILMSLPLRTTPSGPSG